MPSLRFYVLTLFLSVSFPFLAAAGRESTPESGMAGKLVWARLKTASPSWARHARGDHYLLDYIRDNTSVEMNPIWHAADVGNLPQMCGYPFLFCEGLGDVDEPGRKNIREYLLRGGFLFIDSCIAPDVNPRQDVFVQTQFTALNTIVPDLEIVAVPPDHPVFHACYNMPNGLPQTRTDDLLRWPISGMKAIYSKHQLVGMMSTSGLQCGWSGIGGSPRHSTNCIKMMINIYVYAIAR